VKLIDGVPAVFHWIYVFAWFVGFAVAGGVYYAGMRSKVPAQASEASAAKPLA